MRPLRPLLALLLALLLLPWGAYAGGRLPVPAPAALAGGLDGPADRLAPKSAGDRQLQVAPTPKRCPGKGLAGSPCGPDLALAAAIAPPQPEATHAPARPARGRLPAGISLPGILDPPRTC